MIFLLEDNFSFDETQVAAWSSRSEAVSHKQEDVHIFSEKLQMPVLDVLVSRPRLDDMLERSMTQFGATLVCGRAGTGKTTVAASYAAKQANSAWYTVEASDTDWSLFSRYFSASLNNRSHSKKRPTGDVTTSEPNPETISEFLSNVFTNARRRQRSTKPQLIVLDNIHHVFDAEWFNDFFKLLLFSLLPGTHLLLLSRSKPPLPLLRLRSKQLLNVIDEKLLAFNEEETAEFCRLYGHAESTAKRLHQDSFGRISKIVQFVNQGQ